VYCGLKVEDTLHSHEFGHSQAMRVVNNPGCGKMDGNDVIKVRSLKRRESDCEAIPFGSHARWRYNLGPCEARFVSYCRDHIRPFDWTSRRF
jgi:hypothetical protein